MLQAPAQPLLIRYAGTFGVNLSKGIYTVPFELLAF